MNDPTGHVQRQRLALDFTTWHNNFVTNATEQTTTVDYLESAVAWATERKLDTKEMILLGMFLQAMVKPSHDHA